MPTLNDILTANGDYTPVLGYPVDDKYEDDSQVINVYDRTIGEIVGDTSTSGENVSQYLTFRIPRHPDHYDLIENGTNIRILYRLEDDTGEDVVPVNVVANEDYIIFGWKIPLVVTVNPGVVTFIIHAYKSENNIITYHYKTLPKTYSILETMETDVVVPKIEMYNLAEAYTRGTITDVFGHTRPVEEGEPGYHDNSKYYKELAETAIGGKGIQSVTKTSTSGLVDTYTILYTDGTTSTFAVTNGEDGQDGQDGHTPTITASKTDKVTTVYADGVAIATINDGVDGQGAVTDVTVNGVTVMDGNVAKVIVPTKVSDLSNDSGFITGYTETDPTVPSWAKQPSKPTYTASEVGAASEAAVNGISTQLTDRMSAIEAEQAVQDARMDTFTSLPEGSTSGNAELADIRVGADGTTYDTAGNAVRGQISGLKSDLDLLAEASGIDVLIKTVNSVDQMTDTTKKYILQSTGTIWEYGLTKIPTFTNLATVIAEGFRLNTKGGLTAEAGTTTVEDYIDFVTGDVVRVKGLTLGTKNCVLYDSSKAGITTFMPVVDGVVQGVTTALNDGVYTLTSGTSARVKYLRISGILTGTADDVIITRNEEITYTDDHAWVDTGVTPISKEPLYDAIQQNSNDISELSERVTSLETGSGTLTIPSFWQNAVDECIAKIKALQVGKNCITFPFFSDNHQRNGYSGVLIAHIMKECNIPYCFYGGDSISSGTIADEATMIEQDRLFDNIMSHVPNEKMCRAVGNHDGYWYDGTSKHYYSREQIYELFLREESVAQSKHFGDDGTYYYVDDIASKTRFIVMNTNKQRVDNVATGESIDSAQLDWLENKALSFDESGWAVVFISHAPITNNFHALISNAQAVQTFLTNYINGSSVNKADVVGWFSGHIHRDRFYKCDATGNDQTDAENPVYDASNPSTNTLPFMTVTITSDATNISYDDSTKHSIANDDQSHAIDFVTINKTTRTVNLTRLGIGEDRNYTY